MKNLLVTGHTGFLGSHLVNALQTKYNIIGVSNKQRKNLRFTQIKKDIRKITPNDIKFKIDCIIHLAAIVSPKYCETNPTECLETNMIGTQKILEIAHKKKSQFIYLSTSHVYGIPQKLPVKEEHPTTPISIYSASKLGGEIICQAYAMNYKIDLSILRLFSIYGPGEPENFVIPKIISQIKSKKIITLGNLHPKRDFVYVDDVVNAIQLVIRKSKGCHIYNIGTGKSNSVLNVCDNLRKISGKKFKINSIKKSTRVLEAQNIMADIKKLKKLGWKPKVSLNQGLSKCFEEYNKILSN